MNFNDDAAMRKSNMKIWVALVCLMVSVAANAQALKGSYFLDSSLNRHELNPAFAPRAGYFQLLGVGNLGTYMGTNIDMPSLLYPKDGKLLTFLHPDVSMKQFDRAFPNHPNFDIEASATLLGFGFYTKRKGFWTFDLDFKATYDMDIPGDLFRFIKNGTGESGGSYNIGNFNVYSTTGIQASLGFSKNIMKSLRVGVKARVIAPFQYSALNLENVRLTATEDKWEFLTEGYAHIAAQGLEITIPEGDETSPSASFDLNDCVNGGVIAGLGCSFDLGVEYVLEVGSIFDGLSVSAAVTDLGLIRYKPSAVNSYVTKGKVEWGGFRDVSVEGDMDISSLVSGFLDEAQEDLVNLSKMDNGSGLVRSTMPRVHVGVEMPFLRRSMSVGLLYSMRKSHSYSRNELTLSYNLTPCKWFAMGLNYSFLNTAKTMGFIFEFTPRVGPAFYFGWDYMPSEYAPLGPDFELRRLPTAFRYSFNCGLAFQTGGKTTKKPKNKR